MFGLKKSAATRAAERFFKERRVKVHFVDLGVKPIARGELTRFIQKFGLNALLDLEGKAYERSNLAYLRTKRDRMHHRLQLGATNPATTADVTTAADPARPDHTSTTHESRSAS